MSAASTTSPLISVVTASFNQGRFIGDAIESVLAQGWSDFEHIVVDAMSTDETAAVLSSHQHLRVIREPDTGQSDGLNKGFLAARGRFVAWLNADDYFLPGAFDEFERALASHHDGLAFFGHYYLVDEASRFVRSMRIPPFDAAVCRHYGTCWPSTGAFFSSTLFQQRGILLDPSLHIVMDWDFFQRLASQSVGIVRIPRFVAAFRVHEMNKSIGLRDNDAERRERLDRSRLAERRRVEARYGAVTGLGTTADATTRKALGRFHHWRFIAGKLVRMYYMANLLDRLSPPCVRPPRAPGR